ncbi:MAG: hypothetical protein SFX18_04755 [Pirellulales bacterium]|nr:hypothetical protein [Pirellulales bacterium]
MANLQQSVAKALACAPFALPFRSDKFNFTDSRIPHFPHSKRLSMSAVLGILGICALLFVLIMITGKMMLGD